MQESFPSHLRNRVTDSYCWFWLNLWQRKLRFSEQCARRLKHQSVDYELNFRIARKYFNNSFFFVFQFKIQFDDSLTATFEYPSEISLLIDESLNDDDEVDANFYGRSNPATSSSTLLNSVPLGKWIFRVSLIDLIWCYMRFRFNAIRKLSAAESERNGIWVGYHEDNSITIISVKWREHVYIESWVRRWRLLEACHRWRESEMEQRRYERNRFVVLNDALFTIITITAFNYRKTSIPCFVHQVLASSRCFRKKIVSFVL